MNKFFDALIGICYIILLIVLFLSLSERVGIWMTLGIIVLICIIIQIIAPLIIKKFLQRIGYNMRKAEKKKEFNDFILKYSSCKKCNHEGKEGGCPYCGCWPGLGKHTKINDEEYYFLTNTENTSWLYFYHYLLKKLGKKIVFAKAVDRDGNPMSSKWIAVWATIET